MEKNLPQFIYTDQINYPNHIRLFVCKRNLHYLSNRLFFIRIFSIHLSLNIFYYLDE